MNSIKYILIGVALAFGICFIILDGIDLEVARRDYNKNVEQCKTIDGCLFSSNCERYNKMIEQKCKKGE